MTESERERYDAALSYATEKHRGQTRIGGDPYITHPAAVAAIKADPVARAVKAADRLHNLRCAAAADEDFKRRYILESVDWYLDLSPEIPFAVKALAESMETPLTELPFLYEPVETWKIKAKSE